MRGQKAGLHVVCSSTKKILADFLICVERYYAVAFRRQQATSSDDYFQYYILIWRGAQMNSGLHIRGNRRLVKYSCRSEASDRVAGDIPCILPSA
eukprot:6185716-Pleurochrysis_carterae.AAC.1